MSLNCLLYSNHFSLQFPQTLSSSWFSPPSVPAAWYLILTPALLPSLLALHSMQLYSYQTEHQRIFAPLFFLSLERWEHMLFSLVFCLTTKMFPIFYTLAPRPLYCALQGFFFFPSRCRVYVSLKHFLLDPFKFSVSCSVRLKTAEAVSCWFAASQETLPPPGEQAWASMLGHRVHEED